MVDNQTPTNQGSRKISLQPITSFFLYLSLAFVALFVGTVIHFYLKQIMLFNTQNILAVWVLSFILALVIRINYQKPIFLINILLGSLLVSVYPFGQGITIYLLIIFGQRLFKKI